MILSRKEIAAKIGRSTFYVSAMRKAGFPRIVRTKEEAIQWLIEHEKFRSHIVYRKNNNK